MVGHAPGPQGEFERAGERVGAEENREVPRRPAAGEHRSGDLGSDTLGLLESRAIEHDPHRRARPCGGDESFVLPPGVVGDQAVGRPQNIRRAPVVVLQLHDLRGGIVPLELEDVANARAPPSIDRLIGIAGHGEMRVFDRQATEDRILNGVGVLVFVYEDEAVPGIEFAAEVGVLRENRGHVHEQVIEIDRVGPHEHLLVDRPDPQRQILGGFSPAGLEGGRREQVVFRPGDDAGNPVDRRVRGGKAKRFHGPLQRGGRIIGVEDGVVARQPDEPSVATDQPGRESVEGAHLHRLRPHEVGHAVPHFVGCLVGEGQGHDPLGRHPLCDQVRNPVSDHAGLAAARAC